MIKVRHSEERGHANHGWLDSHHTFSFGHYYDQRFMGFGPLRVINEDRVHPGQGFAPHGHRDMEIISYVISGALEHKDSIGTGSVIRPGEVQRMSAGTGIRHSEYNHSRGEKVHFLQIWIEPAKEGLKPSYEQKFFDPKKRQNALKLIGSPDGAEGSVTIHQDVKLYGGLLEAGASVTHATTPDRLIWVQVVHGTVTVEGKTLKAGDGAALEDMDEVTVAAQANAEFLLFDITAAH
ncbi:pirin family protein [Kordiimonas gwangyangensis]|uniref:pirin family protein n=1 Tax=Kordiimonas gwangyangensis TaxID=288022 RepID=UPI000362E3FD|nr:pirin family protein [Kordiimonas gwangyangensis]